MTFGCRAHAWLARRVTNPAGLAGGKGRRSLAGCRLSPTPEGIRAVISLMRGRANRVDARLWSERPKRRSGGRVCPRRARRATRRASSPARAAPARRRDSREPLRCAQERWPQRETAHRSRSSRALDGLLRRWPRTSEAARSRWPRGRRRAVHKEPLLPNKVAPPPMSRG